MIKIFKKFNKEKYIKNEKLYIIKKCNKPKLIITKNLRYTGCAIYVYVVKGNIE